MIFNYVSPFQEFGKVVLDFLIYIYKETNILFDHSILI